MSIYGFTKHFILFQLYFVIYGIDGRNKENGSCKVYLTAEMIASLCYLFLIFLLLKTFEDFRLSNIVMRIWHSDILYTKYTHMYTIIGLYCLKKIINLKEKMNWEWKYFLVQPKLTFSRLLQISVWWAAHCRCSLQKWSSNISKSCIGMQCEKIK